MAFGVCNIVAIVILNWGLFAIMKRQPFIISIKYFHHFILTSYTWLLS